MPKSQHQKRSAKESSTKPKRRIVQNQTELVQAVVRLAISAEKLAQSAERLVDATIRNSQAGERYEETLKTPKPLGNERADEEDADLAASRSGRCSTYPIRQH
jgi:hypothetical protein